MNIYKKRIIDMMRYKSSILSKGDVVYFTAEDEKSIKSWKNADCGAFIDNFNLRGIKPAWDILICPFCFHYKFNYFDDGACEKCSYGTRHNFCPDRYSTYNEILSLHQQSCMWDIFTCEQKNIIIAILEGKYDHVKNLNVETL